MKKPYCDHSILRSIFARNPCVYKNSYGIALCMIATNRFLRNSIRVFMFFYNSETPSNGVTTEPHKSAGKSRERILFNKLTFLCVCLVIDHEFRHHIVNVAVDPLGDSRVDPQTTLTMLSRNS